MQGPAGGQRAALQPVRLEDVLQEEVVTADADTPIRTVVAEMAESDVGSVVVTENEEAIGIVTDRKIALTLEESPDVAQQDVQSIVSGDVATGTPSMTIFEALQVMGDENVRRLPIVDEDGSLRGIVTLDDVLVLLGTELANAVEIIQAQSPRL